MGVSSRAQGLYEHAMKKYQSWGAKAIVRRLEVEMQQKFSAVLLVGQGHPLDNNGVGFLHDPAHDKDDSSGTRKRSA